MARVTVYSATPRDVDMDEEMFLVTMVTRDDMPVEEALPLLLEEINQEVLFVRKVPYVLDDLVLMADAAICWHACFSEVKV